MIPSTFKLLNLLSNKNVTFFIPPYQRNYEWAEEQCKVFLEDICKTAESNFVGKRMEHFFGSVTYFADKPVFGQPDKLILIDGQQRITTTMLFLVALRDILDDEQTKAYIDNNYLKNDSSVDDTQYKIKLKQVETDWETYKRIILGEEVEETEKNSAVYRNFSYFKNKLYGLKNSGKDLGVLISEGLQYFTVVTLELKPLENPWENPQEIFESMNSIGKPLSLADLVRNYLMLGLDSETQEIFYKQYWLKIEKRLSGRISYFIRDYMQMTERKSFKQATETNYKELYSQFKTIYMGIDSNDMLDNLEQYSVYYSWINGDYSTGNKEIDSILKDIRVLNVTTAYSFLMALMYSWKKDDFKTDEMISILTVFNCYCLRKRIIGLANAENKAFPTLVKRIPELIKATDKKAAMFKIVATQENALRLPNDIEMKRHLETMNFYNFKYCKYFLALIEEKLTKSRPDLTDNKLQVEHIMPRTLNATWEKELGLDYARIHQELVNVIGNITLIRHNQELSNKPFKEKLEIYENNSGLQIAKTKITNQKHWNEETIKKRSEWIIDYLLKNIVPIPESMRETNNFIPKEGRHLSFIELGLVGETINFIDDVNITARVIDDKHVEFEGKEWSLSPLTREIYERKGKIRASGSYSGADHWEYDGLKLSSVF